MERKFHVSSKKSLSRVRSARRRPGCIRLFVCPTTGGRMEISVSPRETVFGLKVALARKLRVSPSKISLIYKDRVLKDGCIQDHNILDDSQVTLLPNMESGLSINRSDRSIIQALENLTETQVNDFLSGRSPLMLAIRMGENMVFVQLQLSMLHPAPQRGTATGHPAGASPPPSSATSAPPGAAHQPATTATSKSDGEPQGQRSRQPPPAMTLNSTSALAEATRCLSQRLNRLHELNCNDQRSPRNLAGPYPRLQRLQPAPTTRAGLDTPPTSPAPASSSSSSSSPSASNPHSSAITQQAGHHSHQTKTAFPLPPPPGTTTATTTNELGTHNTAGTTTAPSSSSLPVNTGTPLSPPPSPGAIIDTMRSLGRGIYSGTFQGTLDPSLQDSQGRPRRSVNTILHILNDLLVAAPSQPQAQSQPQAPLAGAATTTSSPLAAAATSTSSSPVGTTGVTQQQQQQQKAVNVLTPPPSPTDKTSAVNVRSALSSPAPSQPSSRSSTVFASPSATPTSEVEENPDNCLLRGKMQRLQVMLAQRKEQRRTRREMNGPYYSSGSGTTSSTGPKLSSATPTHAVVSTKPGVGSSNQAGSGRTAKASAMCVASPSTTSSTPPPTSSSLAAAVQESSCIDELQQHHQQHPQSQQTPPSGSACRNGGDHPCQTCPYCNPSREQDSVAV